MTEMERPSIQQRCDAVRAKLPIGEVIGRAVKLTGTAKAKSQRGRCPFHHGNSASFVVRGDFRSAKCYGCQWSGDVIRFVQDQFGLPFIEALEECEAEARIESPGRGAAPRRALAARPVERARSPAAAPRREWVGVGSLEMGRWIWKHAWADLAAVRRYFTGRGIPDAVLSDARLRDFRYLAECPAVLWEAGSDPRLVIHNPAVVALVRRPVWLVDESSRRPAAEGAAGTDVRPAASQSSLPGRGPPGGCHHEGDFPAARGRLEFVPCGVHVTYLSPDGEGTMVRRKPWAKQDDPDPMLPKRRMLGPVGKGAVMLGQWHADAHLWVGEGNETVLSGMSLAGVGRPPGGQHGDAEGGDTSTAGGPPPQADAMNVGVATLSLDNLQGQPRKWRGGIWPLHALEPDPEHPPFTIPGQRGPVTGLIDADMSPLKAQKVVERKGGPIVERAIGGAERAQICGELFVKGWRREGVAMVDARRAPLGMDFNDVLVAQLAGAAA